MLAAAAWARDRVGRAGGGEGGGRVGGGTEETGEKAVGGGPATGISGGGGSKHLHRDKLVMYALPPHLFRFWKSKH